MFNFPFLKPLIASTFLFTTQTYAFNIYQSIPWKNYADIKGNIFYNQTQVQFNQFLANQNIKPITVVYMSSLLTNYKADPEKLKKVANLSKTSPTTPICLDIEFNPKDNHGSTVPVILDALRMYKQLGGVAPIGVYGELPHTHSNSYPTVITKIYYTSLNNQSAEIANHVDFLFPSLYYKTLKDVNIWDARSKFTLDEAKRFAKKRNLKIIPFISASRWLSYGNKKVKYQPLSASEMKHTLFFLKNQGMDGAVLWDEPNAFDNQNQPAIFDITKEPYKTIVNFANSK